MKTFSNLIKIEILHHPVTTDKFPKRIHCAKSANYSHSSIIFSCTYVNRTLEKLIFFIFRLLFFLVFFSTVFIFWCLVSLHTKAGCRQREEKRTEKLIFVLKFLDFSQFNE